MESKFLITIFIGLTLGNSIVAENAAYPRPGYNYKQNSILKKNSTTLQGNFQNINLLWYLSNDAHEICLCP